jgi:hypothetical protein
VYSSSLISDVRISDSKPERMSATSGVRGCCGSEDMNAVRMFARRGNEIGW